MQAPPIKTLASVPQPGEARQAAESAEPAANAVTEAWDKVYGRPSAPRPVAKAASVHEPFVPLLLCALALLGWLVFQTVLLLQDRQTLQATHAAQQLTVDNAGKLRASLDALAADTQRMADAGNANARVLVEELKKRGVTINPAAATAPGAAATPAR